MIADVELARACQATYQSSPNLPVPYSGVNAQVTTASDGKTQIIAFRGSVTAEDWARDFVFLAIKEKQDEQLGLCHAGFLDGAKSIYSEVAAIVSTSAPYILTGHSLGGALALGVGALLLCNGKRPTAIVTFGAPRFGMQQFVSVLSPIKIHQYRRGNDIVPLVPFDVPPLLHFLDTRDPLIEIGKPQRDFFACHHIDGYVADVQSKALYS